MIEGSLGMIVEGLVSVLLMATIFYCISVNRKLERLRHEQKGMHNFIRELSLATANADKAIKGLRSTVQDSGAELAGQIDKSQAMSRTLQSEIEKAGQVMNRLIVLSKRAQRERREPSASSTVFGEADPLAMVGDLRQNMLGFDDLDNAGAGPVHFGTDASLAAASGGVK